MDNSVPMEVEYPYEFESYNSKPESSWPIVDASQPRPVVVNGVLVAKSTNQSTPQSTQGKNEK